MNASWVTTTVVISAAILLVVFCAPAEMGLFLTQMGTFVKVIEERYPCIYSGYLICISELYLPFHRRTTTSGSIWLCKQVCTDLLCGFWIIWTAPFLYIVPASSTSWSNSWQCSGYLVSWNIRFDSISLCLKENMYTIMLTHPRYVHYVTSP